MKKNNFYVVPFVVAYYKPGFGAVFQGFSRCFFIVFDEMLEERWKHVVFFTKKTKKINLISPGRKSKDAGRRPGDSQSKKDLFFKTRKADVVR